MSKFYQKTTVIFLLSTTFFLAGCGTKKIQTVKIEAEANQIIDVLGENGIKAIKAEVGDGERKTFEIRINGDDDMVAEAIQVMEDHCLGQPEPPEVEGGTVITSMEVERAREQRRMKMNIESQLRQLPGAICVKVNFVPPQDRSLSINPYPSTAAVTINYKTQTFPVSKEEIKGLVARSVPDLKPENVEVVLTAKPPRPLPDNKLAYNFTRIALVSGIGLATIIGFVSIVFYLQKKRRKQVSEEYSNKSENALLVPKKDFEEDDIP